MESVQAVAERLGNEAALKRAHHRIECLEAEVRSGFQSLRALSDAVMSGDPRTASIAQAVRDLLAAKQAFYSSRPE